MRCLHPPPLVSLPDSDQDLHRVDDYPFAGAEVPGLVITFFIKVQLLSTDHETHESRPQLTRGRDGHLGGSVFVHTTSRHTHSPGEQNVLVMEWGREWQVIVREGVSSEVTEKGTRTCSPAGE